MNAAMADPLEMFDLLERWAARGWVREIDLALVRFLRREVPDMAPPLMLAAALVSHQLGRGHVCLDLEATLADSYTALSLPPEQDGAPDDEPLPQPRDLLAGWTLEGWLERLAHPAIVGNGDGPTPLVITEHRLYLYRYWRYERDVEAAIERRLAESERIGGQLPGERFGEMLDALFPPNEAAGRTDWQKIACALAARSAFSIVTGGPGTGKTTAVVRLLALLQSIALAQDDALPLRIRLAAPTGKAAARLKDAIAGAVGRLPAFVQENAALKAAIPTEVSTVHRLLGASPDSRRFRHHAGNPLPVDVLVVDEGSMVDLETMAAMLLALPDSARLVLLGDKDQLASVEAGSVLGELCRRADAGHFTPQTADWVRAATGETVDPALQDPEGRPLDQHIVMLRESRRFDAASGIGQLAAAVNAGDTARIAQIRSEGHADLPHCDLAGLDDPRLESLLLGSAGQETAPPGFAGYLAVVGKNRPALEAGRPAFDAWASMVLKAHGRFQLLCVLRKGPFGVSGMNLRIEDCLRKNGLIRPAGMWYEGRPVLVTRNDYALGLMNGDIGITLGFPSRNKATGQPEWTLRVAFPASDGSGTVHWVLPSRLQSAETVFAMTVHKSQGSEFDHCALLLPPEHNPVLTRELLYTGITRGKRWFTLISACNRRIVDEAASTAIQRSGGLFA